MAPGLVRKMDMKVLTEVDSLESLSEFPLVLILGKFMGFRFLIYSAD